MYAIIELGGKQFKVQQGQRFYCEKLNYEPNTVFDVEKVLFYKDDNKTEIGKPYLTNVKVKARVIEHFRGKKIIVFKYKSKVNYRRKYGHRQNYTSVVIESIIAQ